MPEKKLYDPTRIDITFDPREMRMRGVAYHGNTPFDVPYISHVHGNLWQGGCARDLKLPTEIVNVVSLYPWERYQHDHEVARHEFTAYDSDDPDTLGGMTIEEIDGVANLVLRLLPSGPTLVHCQAGLNRSGLVAALVLVKGGFVANGAEAIALLREKRSPAVLCNPTFERYVRSL